MKKNYFLLAASTMMFAACAQTDVVNEIATEETPQTIGFETFANKLTRDGAAAANTTALDTHHKSFAIWACKELTTNNFVNVYDDNIVNYIEDNETDKWVATPVKFWDKAAINYYFFAAAPKAPSNSNWTLVQSDSKIQSGSYFTIEGYTLSGTNIADKSNELVNTWIDATKGDDDLMIASSGQIKQEKYKNNDPALVPLQFKHILSKLNIKVQAVNLEEYDATITINKLDVVNLVNKGDFTEKPSNNEPRWDLDENSTYTLSAQKDLPSFGGANPSHVYTHEYLIMPQTVDNINVVNSGSKPTEGVYIYIDYTVITKDEKDTEYNEVFKTYYGLADIFNTNTQNESLAFLEGAQNTLKITISPDIIKFDVSVGDTWETATDPEGIAAPEM